MCLPPTPFVSVKHHPRASWCSRGGVGGHVPGRLRLWFPFQLIFWKYLLSILVPAIETLNKLATHHYRAKMCPPKSPSQAQPSQEETRGIISSKGAGCRPHGERGWWKPPPQSGASLCRHMFLHPESGLPSACTPPPPVFRLLLKFTFGYCAVGSDFGGGLV